MNKPAVSYLLTLFLLIQSSFNTSASDLNPVAAVKLVCFSRRFTLSSFRSYLILLIETLTLFFQVKKVSCHLFLARYIQVWTFCKLLTRQNSLKCACKTRSSHIIVYKCSYAEQQLRVIWRSKRPRVKLETLRYTRKSKPCLCAQYAILRVTPLLQRAITYSLI